MTTTPRIIAATTKQQVGIWAFAEVGARGFMHDGNGTLYFDAKPLHRIVRVAIALTPGDLYRITVTNKRTGEELYMVEDLYNDQLAPIIRDLAKRI